MALENTPEERSLASGAGGLGRSSREDEADLPEKMSQRQAPRRQLAAPAHVKALTSTGRATFNQ
jgi:hypothetical protein